MENKKKKIHIKTFFRIKKKTTFLQYITFFVY